MRECNKRSETNVPAAPLLFHLRCNLVDVISQMLERVRPTIEESLYVLEIELEKLGKFLGIGVSSLDTFGEKKFHDSSRRQAILFPSVPVYKDRTCVWVRWRWKDHVTTYHHPKSP